MTKYTFLALTAWLVPVFAACSENPITTLDRNADCSAICDRYHDCVGGDDSEVDACTDRCTDMVSRNETSRIDECDACSGGDNSCLSKAFECLDECAGIVR
ncbi:MAG: hypothetical protein RL701_4806 [Pseudomonadota bacterium]|jgi:hypothetical protein